MIITLWFGVMGRTPSVVDDRLDATELIARVSAERGYQPPRGRRRRRLDTRVGRHRPSTLHRRLVPVAVGATVMLVATMIVTAVTPAEDQPMEPELSAVLAAETTTPPTPEPTTAPPTPPPTSAPPTSTAPRTTRTPRPATPSPAATRPSRNDGVQAAARRGWRLIGGDEFNNGLSGMWTMYDGPGHAGNGRRTPSAISVENGMLVIRGDSNGNTGGMAWKEGRRFGRWEMRARFPKGDSQYHPVLILWPTDHPWPEGGEIDFAETTSASDKVSFFLHYSKSNHQKYAHKHIDITQWHNYAVEWTENAVIGYIDGEKWFESTDPQTLPPGKMHATIQLDYFPSGGNPRPTEMHVDWVRIYA